MKIPAKAFISIRVNNELIKVDLRKEFSIKGDSLEEAPLILGYLVGLQSEVLKALNLSRLERDQYYARMYLVMKQEEGSYSNRPPSDENIKHELNDDEAYIEVRNRYERNKEYYELITGLIDTYKVRIDILRTLSANRRTESQL